jgi:hypothetical protein
MSGGDRRPGDHAASHEIEGDCLGERATNVDADPDLGAAR